MPLQGKLRSTLLVSTAKWLRAGVETTAPGKLSKF